MTEYLTEAVRRGAAVSKQDILLFERIHVMGLEEQLARLSARDQSQAADLEYLAERGVIAAAPAYGIELSDFLTSAMPEDWLTDDDYSWPVGPEHPSYRRRVAYRMASSGRHPSSLFATDEALPPGGELIVAFAQQLVGLPSVALLAAPPTSRDLTALRHSLSFPDEVLSEAPETRIAEVVIQRLPTPAADTPIEDLLAFTQDSQIKGQLERLRLWMARMALTPTDRRALEVEVDQMLHDLDLAMKLEKLDGQSSVLRALVSVPLEIAEELAHLRPAKAVTAASWIQRRRARKLEVALAAPGREVAFIHSAHQAFRS